MGKESAQAGDGRGGGVGCNTQGLCSRSQEEILRGEESGPEGGLLGQNVRMASSHRSGDVCTQSNLD